MSCTKNIKRFLFWKYEGGHDFKVIKFGRFIVNARTDSYFVTRFECKHCGVQHVRHFVSESELLRKGVPIETIAKNRYIEFT
jgi:hypothetical protein